MNALFEAAKEVCAFMEENGWRFCIIGGLAMQRWGEPRTTSDVDITLQAGWGEEEHYINAILDHFESRIPDGHAFGLSRRVLLIRASNGKDVDIALGALPFEDSMIQRAAPVEFTPARPGQKRLRHTSNTGRQRRCKLSMCTLPVAITRSWRP